jgi:quercetin dioxygenase-like cupin family protein
MFFALILAAAIAITPDAVVWKDGPPSLPKGSKIAVLEGDPRAEGIFTMRVRVPAGATLAPHWHPRDERVTILSGAVELGFGKAADRTKTKRYGAGSFYVNPPRAMHYLYFPEETVMQMTGIGPWEIETDVID